jgi:hypothetical protein
LINATVASYNENENCVGSAIVFTRPLVIYHGG